MSTATGMNMHSVIEMVPATIDDSRLTHALDIVEKHSLEWLGRSSDLEMLKSISEIPKAKISHIRELINRVKFPAIPFAYLDPRSYEDESLELQRTISVFVDVVSPMFRPYVLCPLEQYSLVRHIEAREELPVMVPQEHLPIFQMLELCIPVFRGIKSDIEELRRKLELNIRAQQERERLRLRDPLMFAVPKTTGLDGDGLALIGPAWGPDLDEILLKGFGLVPKPNQRAMIEGSMRKLLENDSSIAMLPTIAQDAGRTPIHEALFAWAATGATTEVREGAKRFLAGDFRVLHTDLDLAARIARLCIRYYTTVHQRSE